MAIIKLEASDGQIISMEKSAAEMSTILTNMLEDEAYKVDGEPIPLKKVDPVTLRDIVEYCEKNKSQPAEFMEWLEEFKNQIDGFPKLFRLIKASDYLDIKCLLELTIEKAVEMMKDMTLDDVRGVFNLTNDFTEEEEAKLRQRFGWAFQ